MENVSFNPKCYLLLTNNIVPSSRFVMPDLKKKECRYQSNQEIVLPDNIDSNIFINNENHKSNILP